MLHQYYIIIHQFIYNSTPILYNKYVNTPIYTLSHFRALTFPYHGPKMFLPFLLLLPTILPLLCRIPDHKPAPSSCSDLLT